MSRRSNVFWGTFACAVGLGLAFLLVVGIAYDVGYNTGKDHGRGELLHETFRPMTQGGNG